MLGQMQTRLSRSVDELRDAASRLESAGRSINLDSLKSLSLRPQKKRWPRALLLLGAVAAIGAAAYAWWTSCKPVEKDTDHNGTPRPDAEDTERVRDEEYTGV